nr:transposase [Streptomyces sp. SID8367]
MSGTATRGDAPHCVSRSKSHLALGLLDRLAGWLGPVPVIVADAGYGRSVGFRQTLEDRGWSYVVAVDPKEVVQSEAAAPYRPSYGGLGPPTRPCYRTRPRPLSAMSDAGPRFEEVVWRQGSKGAMTSHFAVLQVRPAGKLAHHAAQ